MKKILLGLILIIAYGFAIAQEEVTDITISTEKKEKNLHEIKTLSGSGHHHGGAFFGFSFKASEFKNETLVMPGFRTGWIVNRALGIGFEGYGIVPFTKYSNIAIDNDAILLGGYGGMYLEPVFFSNQVVHLTFPIAAGAGWLGYHDDWEESLNGNNELIDDDIFWYVEPGVGLEVNVSRNFRVHMGVTKKFTESLELVNTPEDSFGKLNYSFTMKMGRF